MQIIIEIISVCILLYIGSAMFWYLISKIEEWFSEH